MSTAKHIYIAMRYYQESVTTGQTHRQTDRCRLKLSLCAAIHRGHKNEQYRFKNKNF